VSYQPLARKYRPSGFSDLVGQDAVAKALANGIRLGREPHAVIFSGVRGIGKTTIARLYAKALNCESGPTPNPCGTCESCLAVARGTHEDVLEIDGASNTSVDDVRQLRETVDYIPQRSKYKVYIIDEVHMLSNSAFNALLKTLEEPPSHVVFMFATTELHKIPQTIVGRCQTFYLRKFTTEQIADRIRWILSNESLRAEDRVILEIAKRGNGSMRDALTFLDTAIAVSSGELTLERIGDLLSCISSKKLLSLLRAMLSRNPLNCVELLDQLDKDGIEFGDLIEQLAEFCRHAFIIRDLGNQADFGRLTGVDPDLIAELGSIGETAAILDLNRIFRTLMQCLKELDGSNLDRFVVENYLLEWCLDPGLPDIESLRSGATIASSPLLTAQQVRAPSVPEKPVTTAAQEAPKRDLRQAWLTKTSGAETKPDAATSVQIPAISTESESTSSAPKALDIVHSEDSMPALSEERNQEQTAQSILATKESESHAGFPATWRELVEMWQKRKPLQARIFEETYSISFSPEHISIGVNQNSLAGMKLLNRDVQTKVLQQMKELFGFAGQLSVINRQGAETSPASTVQADQTESLLETKRREKEIRIDQIKNELREDPTAQSLVNMFGGRIESIEVTDPS
jgi:DNA polymerase-3 subunit gamma/tau